MLLSHLVLVCVHACWVTLVVSYSLQPCGLSPLSMGFSRQEYWSGLPFLSPRDLPNLGIKSASLCLLPWQADSFINSATWETINPYSLPIRKIMLSLSFLFVLIFKKAFYFVLKWIEVKVTQLCLTLCNPVDYLLCPWDSPGKNTGVGCHFLLQGIFPT